MYLFISRFGIKSGICLLIVPVPVHCFSLTFVQTNNFLYELSTRVNLVLKIDKIELLFLFSVLLSSQIHVIYKFMIPLFP